MTREISFTTHGRGSLPVLVLHDWFCDHSTWDAALPYLDEDRFTWVFADLRGYGGSRGIPGEYTLEEAAGDAAALVRRLEWPRFSLIGHSMGSLIAQRVLQLMPRQVSRAIFITPVGPRGGGLDGPALEFFRSIALADDVGRMSALGKLWGGRLSDTWTRYKLRRWRETADPAAAAKYVELWGATDIAGEVRDVDVPIRVIAGGLDAPPFQAEALKASMMRYYPTARLTTLDASGHYPMQEQPPLLAAQIERFLLE